MASYTDPILCIKWLRLLSWTWASHQAQSALCSASDHILQTFRYSLEGKEFIFVGEWIIIGAPLETCRAYQLYKVLPSGLISNIHSIDFLCLALKTNWKGWSFQKWKAWRSEFDILPSYICPPGCVVDKSILQKSTEDKEDAHPGPHVDGFRVGHRGQWVLDAGLEGE